MGLLCGECSETRVVHRGFGIACASKENSFSVDGLRQLHQWQLWQQEMGSGIELPQSLHEKCGNTFFSASYSGSKLQDEVVGELKAAGLDLDEEVLLGSGYRIDALVKVGDGRRVAVEVDGPSHFIQQWPTGSTTLKHSRWQDWIALKLCLCLTGFGMSQRTLKQSSSIYAKR